jgi:hypothetical protein
MPQACLRLSREVLTCRKPNRACAAMLAITGQGPTAPARASRRSGGRLGIRHSHGRPLPRTGARSLPGPSLRMIYGQNGNFALGPCRKMVADAGCSSCEEPIKINIVLFRKTNEIISALVSAGASLLPFAVSCKRDVQRFGGLLFGDFERQARDNQPAPEPATPSAHHDCALPSSASRSRMIELGTPWKSSYFSTTVTFAFAIRPSIVFA